MFDRNDCCQALTNILTRQIILIFLENLIFLGIVVDNTSQSCTETLFMGSTLVGVDVVGKADHIFMVGGGILHGHLNCYLVHFSIRIDGRFKDRILVFVQVFHIRSNPTLVMVILGLFQTIALVHDGQLESTIEKGQFLDPLV